MTRCSHIVVMFGFAATLLSACSKGPTIAEAEAALKAAVKSGSVDGKIECSVKFKDNRPRISSVDLGGAGRLTTFCRSEDDPLQKCFAALIEAKIAVATSSKNQLCLALKDDQGSLREDGGVLREISMVTCGKYDDVVVSSVHPASATQAKVFYELRPSKGALDGLQSCGELEHRPKSNGSADVAKHGESWTVR